MSTITRKRAGDALTLPLKRINHSLTYASDLIIRDRGTLASLCVFFDDVVLPYIPPDNAGVSLRVTLPKGSDVPISDLIDMPSAGEFLHEWDASHAPLYDSKVLRRLPPLDDELEIDDDAIKVVLSDLRPNISGFSRHVYFLARVIHHLRRDNQSPQLIDTTLDVPTSVGYNSILAHETFSAFVPSLGSLSPEQILEVREKVADTREGFALHLRKLSRDVEQRTSQGDPIETIQRYARSVVETKLIPDYFEFRRQLPAERFGYLAQLFDFGANALKIVVAGTTGQFVGSGFSTFSALASLVRERKQIEHTNERLAYRFLEKIQAEVVSSN